MVDNLGDAIDLLRIPGALREWRQLVGRRRRDLASWSLSTAKYGMGWELTKTAVGGARRDSVVAVTDVAVGERIDRVAPGGGLRVAQPPRGTWVAVVVEWTGDDAAERRVALDLPG